jgi:hypothetical protein
MKSVAIFAIIAATVSAEAEYQCDKKELTAWSVETVLTVTDAKTKDACGTACTDQATLDDQVTKDYCCHFITEKESAEGAADGTNTCTLLVKTSVEGEVDNVKVAMANTDTKTFEAWAWNKGVAMNDMATTEETETTEEAKDSANMITSAIATIAAIAMVAY